MDCIVAAVLRAPDLQGGGEGHVPETLNNTGHTQSSVTKSSSLHLYILFRRNGNLPVENGLNLQTGTSRRQRWPARAIIFAVERSCATVEIAMTISASNTRQMISSKFKPWTTL